MIDTDRDGMENGKSMLDGFARGMYTRPWTLTGLLACLILPSLRAGSEKSAGFNNDGV